MKKRFVLLLMMFMAAGWVWADSAPAVPDVAPPTDPLATLRDLTGNETALVDAARAFDKQQAVWAALDVKLADEQQKAGNAEGAKARRDQARKRYQAVREAYEFVLKQYHNDARAQTFYGELLYDHFGEIDAAVQAWLLAASLDPKLSAPLNDLGIHYCHQGQYERGIEYYDKALALDPNNPDYLFNIVQTYLINFPQVQEIRKWNKQRVFAEAMKLSKRAAELSPNDFALMQDYAVNFFAAENFDVKADWKEAARAWQAVRQITASPDKVFYTWLNEARVWIRDGNKTKARSCLEEALKIRPENPVATNLLDQVKNEKASPEKASPKTVGGRKKAERN